MNEGALQAEVDRLTVLLREAEAARDGFAQGCEYRGAILTEVRKALPEWALVEAGGDAARAVALLAGRVAGRERIEEAARSAQETLRTALERSRPQLRLDASAGAGRVWGALSTRSRNIVIDRVRRDGAEEGVRLSCRACSAGLIVSYAQAEAAWADTLPRLQGFVRLHVHEPHVDEWACAAATRFCPGNWSDRRMSREGGWVCSFCGLPCNPAVSPEP